MAKPRARPATRTRDSAPDLCETHWAFDAISVPARRGTLAQAARRTPLTTATPEDAEIILSIAALGTAYDLAVGERFDAEVASADWSARAPETAHALTLAAERAYTLLSALPLPADPLAVGMRRMHLIALAIVAGRPDAYTAWRDRLLAADRLPAPTALTAVWEALLTEGKFRDVDELREQIARVREELTTAPTRAASLDLSMRGYAQINLATAAGDLLTYRTSGSPTNLLARLAVLMQDARRGTPGDREMRALLVWLAYAVAAFVAPRNDQLTLPSV